MKSEGDVSKTVEVSASSEQKSGMVSHAPEIRRRWASGLSLPPLGLIVASFFLPTITTCSGSEFITLSGYDLRYQVYPIYIAAAILLLTTAGALVRRHPTGRLLGGAASAALVLSLGTWLWIGWATLGSPLQNLEEVDWGRQGFVATYLLTTGVMACLLFVRGIARVGGWHRWSYFVGAYGCLAATWLPFTILGVGGIGGLEIGWDMFGAAVLVLLFIIPCASWVGET